MIDKFLRYLQIKLSRMVEENKVKREARMKGIPMLGFEGFKLSSMISLSCIFGSGALLDPLATVSFSDFCTFEME